MSRTFRKDRWSNYKKLPDGKHRWRCRCDWCINIEYRDRNGLTIKNDLKANGENDR